FPKRLHSALSHTDRNAEGNFSILSTFSPVWPDHHSPGLRLCLRLDILAYCCLLWRRKSGFSFYLPSFDRQPSRIAHPLLSSLDRLVAGTCGLYFAGIHSVSFPDGVAGLEETSCGLTGSPQPTAGVRLAACWESTARRGCALPWIF